MSTRHKSEGGKAKTGTRGLCQYKKVAVLPIIIEALGTVGKGFRTWIRKIQMEKYCNLMLNSLFLSLTGTCR